MNLPEVFYRVGQFQQCRNDEFRDGDVEFRLWTYRLHQETDDGRAGPPVLGFHLVSGVVDDSDGSPEVSAFSKCGGGPVNGPRPPESFRPAEGREFDGVNPFGHRVYLVRDDVREFTYRAPAAATDGRRRQPGPGGNPGTDLIPAQQSGRRRTRLETPSRSQVPLPI